MRDWGADMEFLLQYAIGTGLVLAILSGWVGVQHWYRHHAARHPEYGPAQECMGCGLSCSCDSSGHAGHTKHDTDRGETK